MWLKLNPVWPKLLSSSLRRSLLVIGGLIWPSVRLFFVTFCSDRPRRDLSNTTSLFRDESPTQHFISNCYQMQADPSRERLNRAKRRFDLTVKCPSWWSGKWMKRYSVATSCMMESPRNSILWLWPLEKDRRGGVSLMASSSNAASSSQDASNSGGAFLCRTAGGAVRAPTQYQAARWGRGHANAAGVMVIN